MMIPTLESNRKWGLPFAAVLGLLSVALVALFSVTSDRPKTTSAFLQRTLGENRDRAQMGDFPEEFSVSQESESKENYKRPFDYPRPRPAPVDSDTTTTTQSPSKRPNTNFPVPDTSTVPNGTSQTPTQFPSTIGPTAMTALTPTAKPTVGPTTTILAYKPGLINTIENGLHLSEGLTSRVIAISGQKVSYANGETSNLTFHEWPDGGEVFPDQRPDNEGGWILVSNSEEDQVGKGGVGAITFDSQGNVTNYQMILTGTLMNCNGGKTFFGGWVSCEEDFWSAEGQCWLTDPTGSREAKPISLGSDGGIFEAYAEDVRDMDNSHFFITEDDRYGAMQRWTPNNPNWNEPWQLLLGEGVTDYLVLIPTVEDHSQGNYSWTTDKAEAQNNAGLYYPNSEGIAISENTLFFVCKRFSHIYELDLDVRNSIGNRLYNLVVSRYCLYSQRKTVSSHFYYSRLLVLPRILLTHEKARTLISLMEAQTNSSKFSLPMAVQCYILQKMEATKLVFMLVNLQVLFIQSLKACINRRRLD